MTIPVALVVVDVSWEVDDVIVIVMKQDVYIPHLPLWLETFCFSMYCFDMKGSKTRNIRNKREEKKERGKKQALHPDPGLKNRVVQSRKKKEAY